MELIFHPNDILRTNCRDLKNKPSEAILNFMWNTVKEKNGIGLAAPQIGETINLFIVNTAKDKFVVINPRIVSYSAEIIEFEEGCLSIPETLVNIKRPAFITLEYRDENFNKKNKFFNGIAARVIQHEYDHLKGVLILDHK